MIAAGDDQLYVGHAVGDHLKSIADRVQSFIGSPLAEGQNPVAGVASPGKIRTFRILREDAMGPEMHVAASVLLPQYLAVSGNQNGKRIGLEEQFCRHSSGKLIKTRKSHARIVQIDAVHQMMQGYVGIETAEP